MARMARIFGLYRLVVVASLCAYSKIYFFVIFVIVMMFLCNSGSLVYGATVYSGTTVTSDTVTGVHMQQACS